MRLPRTVIAAATSGARRRPRSNGGQPRTFASRLFRPLMAAALVVGAAALTLGLTFGLPGLASDEPSTAVGLQSLLQGGTPLVVFSEFGEEADTLWAADPDDPTDRIQLGRVNHALGYGISPTLSPDGTRIAYTALPPEVARPGLDTLAELWTLDTAGGKTRRLAQGVDLLAAPVWSPAGDAVVVRRGGWRDDGSASFQLLRIDMNGASVQIAAAEADLLPIDFSPDGAWFFYASFTRAGTELMRAPAGGGASETVAHLSDGVARDWRLSPDGMRLAYLAQAPADANVAFVLRVLDLQTGEVAASPDDGAAQFSPLWERDGVLTVGRLDGGGTPARLIVEGAVAALEAALLPGPAGGTGFDVPISWSPDGVHLAVRGFAAASLADPGPSRVLVVATDGGRRELSPLSDITIVGWLEVAP